MGFWTLRAFSLVLLLPGALPLLQGCAHTKASGRSADLLRGPASGESCGKLFAFDAELAAISEPREIYERIINEQARVRRGSPFDLVLVSEMTGTFDLINRAHLKDSLERPALALARLHYERKTTFAQIESFRNESALTRRLIELTSTAEAIHKLDERVRELEDSARAYEGYLPVMKEEQEEIIREWTESLLQGLSVDQAALLRSLIESARHD